MSYSIPFHDVYRNLLVWLLECGSVQANARTGREVLVGRGGTGFRVDLSDGILPTCGLRKTYPKSAAAETGWYIVGVRDVTWLRKYAPLWDKFVEADGVTIDSAYGYRWQRHFGRNQLSLGVEQLRNDPTCRRVYVSAWDPSVDGLGAKDQKNVPCPVGFSLNVLDGQLHSTLTLRSSDVFVGLPYDVMGHALLMRAIATSLNIQLGVMQVTLAHAHLYDSHWDMAAECVRQLAVAPALVMPDDIGLRDIEQDPDGYVADIAALAGRLTWPDYAPRPDVVL